MLLLNILLDATKNQEERNIIRTNVRKEIPLQARLFVCPVAFESCVG